MTPAKKAQPSLAEVLAEPKTDPEVLQNDPVAGEDVNTGSKEDTDLEDSDTEDAEDRDAEGNLLIPVDAPVANTWKENPDHNLGTLHPDVVRAEPNNPSAVQVVTYVTEYANPAEFDDKGLVGPVDSEPEPKDDSEVVED